jgi:hypothetical protein
VSEQVGLFPLHAPPHPAKTEPELGVAVSVNDVPAVVVSVQAAPPTPQEMPAGALETRPLPTPPTCTVRVSLQAVMSPSNGNVRSAASVVMERDFLRGKELLMVASVIALSLQSTFEQVPQGKLLRKMRNHASAADTRDKMSSDSTPFQIIFGTAADLDAPVLRI